MKSLKLFKKINKEKIEFDFSIDFEDTTLFDVDLKFGKFVVVSDGFSGNYTLLVTDKKECFIAKGSVSNVVRNPHYKKELAIIELGLGA